MLEQTVFFQARACIETSRSEDLGSDGARKAISGSQSSVMICVDRLQGWCRGGVVSEAACVLQQRQNDGD